jgi:hypothetical protein
MDFREVMDKIVAVRKRVPVGVRTQPSFVTSYKCSCGAIRSVVACHGVEYDHGVPVPLEISCSFCGGAACLRVGAGRVVAPSSVDGYDFLRVPSRKASIELAQKGRFEAQLVEYQDPITDA